MIDKKIRRQLEVIDWDFPVDQPGETKIGHWYPGTFPSQLPATLIQALTAPGEIVFDPYGGAGTCALEAIRLGRKAFIVDINPVGILANYPICALLILKRINPNKLEFFLNFIARLLSPEPGDLLEHSGTEEQNIAELDAILNKHIRPTPENLLRKIRKNHPPQKEELKKWIEKETLSDTLELYANLTKRKDCAFFSIFIELMISANLRALCSQNKSWGHVADNVYPKEFVKKDVAFQLKKWLKTLQNNIKKVKLESSLSLKGIQYWADIHDWTQKSPPTTKPSRQVDIIVTSPPYGDAIDYVLAQKLSLYFLGYQEADIYNLCMREIGARRKRLKANSRNQWATEMADAATRQSGFISSGSFVSILPHKNHGREIGIKTMTEALKKNGWTKVFEIDRSINQKKTRQSWTSIKEETICVFAK